ncbi:diguanylate cyclase domain-containing protein [Kineococcus aurantiacus]|uniref:Diguanylate cyclase (GGDEF)-like protein n=1 Tax=Kineococcus aurantiacus TaxID=37633 RepID=A0A7Y9DJB2_9ACTN|nr:diguanylate cyclase (GGDEF)-like protein [Kineococcus aurantiacus]
MPGGAPRGAAGAGPGRVLPAGRGRAPAGSSRRPRVTGAGLAAAAAGIGALAGLVWWVLPDEAVLSPWWTQVFGWPAALLLRCDPVQRWIGGGRLDNRVWVRVLLASGVFGLTVAWTGVSFLFPVFTALVASVHLQWSGARAWRPCAVVTVLLSTTLQVLVQAGWLPTPLPPALDLVAFVITLLLSLLLIGNVAVLAAQREAENAAADRERRARHDALLHAATHDPLTGQLNRAGLHEHFTRHVAGAGDHAPADAAGDAVGPVAVLYLDLDGFKPVNDRYGHAAGDRLLQLAAQRLAALLRPGDGLARLGGDEFVVVLATADPTAVQEVAARAEAALNSPFDLDGVVVRVSASTGTARSTGPVTLDDLLRRADTAMYAAKASRRGDGRGRAEVPAS